MEKEIKKLCDLIKYSEGSLFFTGAGVSTDSGIPDFRGDKGLYKNSGLGNEYYLSRECLVREPEEFYRFFRKNMLFSDARPNSVHYAMARLEKAGLANGVITQNIDGLHTAAGSERVIELHGNCRDYYCMRCGKSYTRMQVEECDGICRCSDCAGIVRPRVTLYGEALEKKCLEKAEAECERAELVIACGTSLTVWPAASFAQSAKKLVILNLSPTPLDNEAELVIRAPLGDVFGKITREFFAKE